MNKTNYLLLGLIVVMLTTLINLGKGSGGSRSWSSGSGSGWSYGGGHK